ncbi:alpha/beta fold hydrolase [Salmonirosea aquatica]|uniref:Alpha/beta fold hydrolase n=1 Tax=Salmonirosea aquatica TaxID=2654236 RepID=A0A7C9FPS5_9BACT|nr:alpha/beta fold hydrolase [Cytophagaceae bacterium SJW1-29]
MKQAIIVLLSLFVPTLLRAQAQTVEVYGRRYSVQAKGIENRKEGTPVFILENGLGVGFEHWDTVTEGLSQLSPVLAYDRAGIGESEKVYKKPTVRYVADNLKQILTQLAIAPPYILIGHSMGGVYVRGYAGLYPDDVKGLVFIDPADFTETKKEWNQIFEKLGVPTEKIDQLLFKRLYEKSSVDSVRYGPWSESEYLKELRRTDFAEINALPLPEVPIYFFIGGRFEVPEKYWSDDFDQRQFFSVRTDINIKRWRNFIYSSPKGGSLIYLSNSGHFLHRDDARSFLGNIKILFDDVTGK